VDVWVLSFFIFFASGEAFVLEADERFATEEECKTVGDFQGTRLLTEIMLRSPMPVSGKFNCVLAGADT